MNHQRIVSVRFHDAFESDREEFKNVLSHVGTPDEPSFEHQKDEFGMVVVTITSSLSNLEIDRFVQNQGVKVPVTFDKTEEESHDYQMV